MTDAKNLMAKLLHAKNKINESFDYLKNIYEELDKSDNEELKNLSVSREFSTEITLHDLLWISDSYEIDYINIIIEDCIKSLNKYEDSKND